MPHEFSSCDDRVSCWKRALESNRIQSNRMPPTYARSLEVRHVSCVELHVSSLPGLDLAALFVEEPGLDRNLVGRGRVACSLQEHRDVLPREGEVAVLLDDPLLLLAAAGGRYQNENVSMNRW